MGSITKKKYNYVKKKLFLKLGQLSTCILLTVLLKEVLK
jgi:hypothetical protein